MCVSPKSIINRSNHFTEYMPLRMYVPCGKCEECRSTLQNDWFVRCFFEWRSTLGDTFFYTLTYNNDNLPSYCGIPVFSKRHIQLFIKRLRAQLRNFDVSLKYMVTSEFGHITHRPHYHALFYLDKKFNPFQFYSLVQKTWGYGFVQYGNNVGVVNSYLGIQYVVKYITKDVSYTDEFDKSFCKILYRRYSKFLDNYSLRFNDRVSSLFLHLDLESCTFCIRSLIDLSLLDEDIIYFRDKLLSKIRSKFHLYRPFHLQSSKLGLSILDLDKRLLYNESLPIMKHSGVVNYHLPRYIKRKLWYDVIESEQQNKNGSWKRNRFVLSDEGKKHLLSRLDDMCQSKIRKYREVVMNSSNISDTCLLRVNEALSSPSRPLFFPNKVSLTFFLQHFDLDIELMGIYSSIFRGRLCPIDFDFDNVKNKYIDYVTACLYNTSSLDYGKIYESKYYLRMLESRLFDYTPYFQLYERACKIFDEIIAQSKFEEYEAKKDKEKLVRQTREFFNKKSINDLISFAYGQEISKRSD